MGRFSCTKLFLQEIRKVPLEGSQGSLRFPFGGVSTFHLSTGSCFKPQNLVVFYQPVNLTRGFSGFLSLYLRGEITLREEL